MNRVTQDEYRLLETIDTQNGFRDKDTYGSDARLIFPGNETIYQSLTAKGFGRTEEDRFIPDVQAIHGFIEGNIGAYSLDPDDVTGVMLDVLKSIARTGQATITMPRYGIWADEKRFVMEQLRHYGVIASPKADADAYIVTGLPRGIELAKELVSKKSGTHAD